MQFWLDGVPQIDDLLDLRTIIIIFSMHIHWFKKFKLFDLQIRQFGDVHNIQVNYVSPTYLTTNKIESPEISWFR